LFFPRFKNQADEQMEGPVDNSVVKNLINGPSGITGANEYLRQVASQYTGPRYSAQVLSLFPSATGPVETPYIATLDELMASHEAVITQEQTDITNLQALKNPSREGFRSKLFQWASLGFPDLYIVQSININPPNICSDGVTRNLGKYIEYCLGTDMGTVIQGIAALMTGINPTWSTDGNCVRIHVTRAS
jgi:hypothetical protein